MSARRSRLPRSPFAVSLRRFCVAALGAALVAGCQTPIGDFTVMATDNVSSEGFGRYRPAGRQSGEDYSHIFAGIPIGHPTVRGAVDDAVAKVPGGVALANADLYYSTWTIPYLYGRTTYTVEGEVLVDPARLPRSRLPHARPTGARSARVPRAAVQPAHTRPVHRSVTHGPRTPATRYWSPRGW